MLSNAERHRLTKLVASLERKMETAASKVEAARAAMAEVDQTDFAALTEAQSAVDGAQEALGQLEEQWLEASEQLSM